MTTINISRRELYEKIWAAPLQKVADDLDCDYWRLRAACIDAGIPVPPKGYWMKVAYAKPLPERPALSDHPRGYNTVPLHVGNSAEKAMIAARRDTALSFGALKVPDKLSDPHPAIDVIIGERGKHAYSGKVYAILTAPPTECTQRGFRISNVIAVATERLGFRVAPASDGGLVISSDYHDTHVRVREKLQQIRILAPGASHPKKGESTRGHYGYDLKSTGMLEIQFRHGKWAEEPKDDLEASLPRLLARLVSDRDYDKERAASAAERERFREIESRKRARAKRIADQEALAFGELLEMSIRWTAASQARAFLAAVRAAGPSQANDPTLEWLTSRIAAHDPLHDGPDPVLERLAAIRNDIGEWGDLE